MTLAYRYIRFSSKAQERGTSVERQEAATQALCDKEGWEVAETFYDLGRSAWKGDHLRYGNLGRFKMRVDAGEIPAGSVLVIENMDRLSRQDVKLARRWVEDITDQGILVGVCSPEIILDDDALSGSNIAAMVQYLLEAGRSNKESDRKSQLINAMWDKHIEGARNGKVFTARCPGWLRVVGSKNKFGDDRRFEVIAEHGAVIRQIYEWSAEGIGAYAICAKLNQLGIKPWGKNFYKHPGTYWRHRYVRDILFSPAVEGEYHPKRNGVPTGERIEGYYPRIEGVDADLIARARSNIIDRRGTGGSHRTEARNLFAGKVRCGHCGNNMVRTVQRKKFEYLICQNANTKGGCTNRGYRYDFFEKAALDEILHLALDDKHFQKPDETKPLVAALAEANKAIENKEAEQQRLLGFIVRSPDAAEAEQLLNEMRPELAKMKTERDQLQRDLDRARGAVSPDEHLRRVMQVSNAIYSDDNDVREAARRMVREAVHTIVDTVVCRAKPDKRIQMSLAGGRIGFLFDNRGNMVNQFDLEDRSDLEPGFVGLADQAWADIKRRKAAGQKDGPVFPPAH